MNVLLPDLCKTDNIMEEQTYHIDYMQYSLYEIIILFIFSLENHDS